MKPRRQRRAVMSGFVMLLTLLAACTGQAAPVQLTRQVLTLPAGAGMPIFGDIDGDGRLDLLVIDQSENKLLSYHQGANGFASSPDQTMALPPQTGWVALCDVDAHPGMELLMSTATGVFYSRQNGGRFEPERHTLIEANQVFTKDSHPILITLNTNNTWTNDMIPVISAGQTVLYRRDANYVWSPEPPIALTAKHTGWSVSREQRRNPWAVGENYAYNLSIQQSYQARPQDDDQKPENEAIRKIFEDMKKDSPEADVTMDLMDVDGDGRKDVVLWKVSGKWDFRTDFYIFLRGADGKLPDRPTQVLHGRGLPIPLGNEFHWSPLGDLNGDGVCELVLLEFKTSATSVSGALETALSHGLDWGLTIRSFRHGGFPGSAEASLPITMILPAEMLQEWPIFIKGDFNGDGRPDVLTRRTETQWNIFLSTADGQWFAPQPAITFETPAQGYMTVRDLNGDGLADIFWYEPDDNRISIFMSPTNLAKGKKP